MFEKLENMETPVVLGTSKRHFVEDKFLFVDCVYNPKKMRPFLKDWIGLYPCENIKLHEPLIFEYVVDHPLIDSCRFKIRFMSHLFAKFIHCSGKYQFMYVDSYSNEIIATSIPIEFVHMNDCNCNIAPSHLKSGQDINVVIQRLKCLEARLLEYEECKKEATQLNEQLVNKLKVCEMLRSRGEQFIDGLYNALDQKKPVKLTNSKGYTRWIKPMCTTEIRNHMLSTKTVKNDVYLTALINTQEHEIQRLQNINNELETKISKLNEQLTHVSESEISEIHDEVAVTQFKSFTIDSISSAVVKFIDDSEISDDSCE